VTHVKFIGIMHLVAARFIWSYHAGSWWSARRIFSFRKHDKNV